MEKTCGRNKKTEQETSVKGNLENSKKNIQKICLACKKQIKEYEYYYTIIQFDKGKKIGEESLHQDCWEKSMNLVNLTKKADFSLNKITEMLGIENKQILEIK